MTHILKHFRDVQLPKAMTIDDLSTGRADAGLRSSIGGVYDYFGESRRLPRVHTFAHKGLYVGELRYRVTSAGDFRVTSDGSLRITAADKIIDLLAKVDDLKGQVGNWGELWRERLSDGQLTYKWCRLLAVNHVENVDNANAVSEVESEYETRDVGWRGETETVSTTASAGATAALLVSNGGAILISDAILSITATSGTVTQVIIIGYGVNMTWTGSLANGNTLEIDAGLQTITNNGTDAYSGLVLNAGHGSDDWLSLPVGMGSLAITPTGGNISVEVEFQEQWP